MTVACAGQGLFALRDNPWPARRHRRLLPGRNWADSAVDSKGMPIEDERWKRADFLEQTRMIPEISSDPNVLAGKPVIAGTRISVELILNKLGAAILLPILLLIIRISPEPRSWPRSVMPQPLSRRAPTKR